MIQASNRHTSEVELINKEQAIERLNTFDWSLEKADMFDHIHWLPDKAQALLASEVKGYTACDKMRKKLKTLGYTCEYDSFNGVLHRLEETEEENKEIVIIKCRLSDDNMLTITVEENIKDKDYFILAADEHLGNGIWEEKLADSIDEAIKISISFYIKYTEKIRS